MNITVTYWDGAGDREMSVTFSGDPKDFPIWLRGMLATGVFVTRVTM